MKTIYRIEIETEKPIDTKCLPVSGLKDFVFSIAEILGGGGAKGSILLVRTEDDESLDIPVEAYMLSLSLRTRTTKMVGDDDENLNEL